MSSLGASQNPHPPNPDIRFRWQGRIYVLSANGFPSWRRRYICRGNPCGCPREGDVIGNGLRQAKSQRTLAELRLTPACCFHPPYQKAKRATKAIIPRRTVKAERAVPFSTLDRCSSVAGRAADRVHPVRKFALCIWQAPRLAATFGSFWSLQKELAEGRESGEKWILNLIFPFPSFLRRRQGIWGDVDLESGFCLLLQSDC